MNTTGSLVSICQNDKFQFSFLQNTYLGLAQAITSTASTLGFWYIQRRKLPSAALNLIKIHWPTGLSKRELHIQSYAPLAIHFQRYELGDLAPL